MICEILFKGKGVRSDGGQSAPNVSHICGFEEDGLNILKGFTFYNSSRKYYSQQVGILWGVMIFNTQG